MRPTRHSACAKLGVLSSACLLVVVAGPLRAQDPVKVAPTHFKVLLENESVRVLDFHSKSGDKIPMHSHPAYVTYSLSGSGKTKFTSPDGKTTEQPSQTGQVRWHDAETHATEYVGTGGTHVLLVELKAQPPSPPKP
jgi:quercetin dioxygenase-like cupin family protein